MPFKSLFSILSIFIISFAPPPCRAAELTLSAAIAGLRPGEVSTPVAVDNSYWILKARERLADEVTAFDQVKERIQEELSRLRFEKVYGDYIADAHRTVEQNNEAADVIAGDLLHAKAQPDPERATKHR